MLKPGEGDLGDIFLNGIKPRCDYPHQSQTARIFRITVALISRSILGHTGIIEKYRVRVSSKSIEYE
jgi:hypothetical protein